jgi:hypothetical protein
MVHPQPLRVPLQGTTLIYIVFRFLAMQYKFLGLVLIAVLITACSCACTEEATEVQTPVPTTAATPQPTTAAPEPTEEFSLEPSPTDEVPVYHQVTVSVHRNEIPVYPYLAIRFDGGRGQPAVTDLEATVYLETGEIKKETFEKKDNQIPTGSEIQIDGSQGTDRVVVVATYTDGSQAKVYDALHEFGERAT